MGEVSIGAEEFPSGNSLDDLTVEGDSPDAVVPAASIHFSTV